jgi:CYTH domain-containing protein
MPKEIERKFLIPLKHHEEFLGRQGVEITQAYLSQDVDRTVRVRLVRPATLGETATLTIKGRATQDGLLRPERVHPHTLRCNCTRALRN